MSDAIEIRHRVTGAALHEVDAASLIGACLREENLEGADLERADLRDADLRGASLLGASLMGADFRGANLVEANLRGANLGYADLRNAMLWGADLRNANLGGADLRGANLRRARLTGARLFATNLRWADLSGAIGIVSFGPVGRDRDIGYVIARTSGPPDVLIDGYQGPIDGAITEIAEEYGENSAYERLVTAAREALAEYGDV